MIIENNKNFRVFKYIILSFVMFLYTNTYSQNEKSNLYSGGMLIFQPGYAITQNNHQTIEEIGFGIGGILRFYFYDFFTAGIFGGSQKSKYNSLNSQNSFISLGYGGVFVGFSKKIQKFRYTMSFFSGNGSIKNLHIESQENNQLIDAHLYNSNSLLISPIISIDYSITERISFTSQAVCLITNYNKEKFYNPIFQLGILFNR
jgi:hypothetical protein